MPFEWLDIYDALTKLAATQAAMIRDNFLHLCKRYGLPSTPYRFSLEVKLLATARAPLIRCKRLRHASPQDSGCDSSTSTAHCIRTAPH